MDTQKITQNSSDYAILVSKAAPRKHSLLRRGISLAHLEVEQPDIALVLRELDGDVLSNTIGNSGDNSDLGRKSGDGQYDGVEG